MKLNKRWKVILTGNEFWNGAKETYYIWGDSREQVKLIASALSTMHVLYATATTRNVSQQEM